MVLVNKRVNIQRDTLHTKYIFAHTYNYILDIIYPHADQMYNSIPLYIYTYMQIHMYNVTLIH